MSISRARFGPCWRRICWSWHLMNAQVNLLQQAHPADIRVGTVDKFQGQEAEVVLISMTTSSGEDLPRDLAFLFDRNRLNVAISRAKTLAIVVASPGLLANAFATRSRWRCVEYLMLGSSNRS